MGKEQNKEQSTQVIIDEIKRNPKNFVLSKKELREIIAEREAADQELKERGLTVILESNG